MHTFTQLPETRQSDKTTQSGHAERRHGLLIQRALWWPIVARGVPPTPAAGTPHKCHPHAVILLHGILAALTPQSLMVTAGCGGRWCTAVSCPPRLGAGTLHECAMAATAICCPARLSALLLHATALMQGACCRPAACHSRLWRPFVRCGILPSPPSCWYAAWMCEGRSGPVSPCSVASALAARHHSHVRLKMVKLCSKL